MWDSQLWWMGPLVPAVLAASFSMAVQQQDFLPRPSVALQSFVPWPYILPRLKADINQAPGHSEQSFTKQQKDF